MHTVWIILFSVLCSPVGSDSPGISRIHILIEGSNTTIPSCGSSTADGTVRWYFYGSESGNKQDKKVICQRMGCNNKNKTNGYDVTEGLDLIIRRIGLEHAGRYSCTKNVTVTVYDVEVMVLESQPACGTFPNQSNDGISLDEVGSLQLTCTIKFNGNLRASMEWRLGNGLGLPGYIETTETTSNLTDRNGTSVSSSITVSNSSADFTNDVRFNCTVYFRGTSNEDPPKNSEKYVAHSWISPTILANRPKPKVDDKAISPETLAILVGLLVASFIVTIFLGLKFLKGAMRKRSARYKCQSVNEQLPDVDQFVNPFYAEVSISDQLPAFESNLQPPLRPTEHPASLRGNEAIHTDTGSAVLMKDRKLRVHRTRSKSLADLNIQSESAHLIESASVMSADIYATVSKSRKPRTGADVRRRPFEIEGNVDSGTQRLYTNANECCSDSGYDRHLDINSQSLNCRTKRPVPPPPPPPSPPPRHQQPEEHQLQQLPEQPAVGADGTVYMDVGTGRRSSNVKGGRSVNVGKKEVYAEMDHRKKPPPPPPQNLYY